MIFINDDLKDKQTLDGGKNLKTQRGADARGTRFANIWSPFSFKLSGNLAMQANHMCGLAYRWTLASACQRPRFITSSIDL
jgi:hypothetical protein